MLDMQRLLGHIIIVALGLFITRGIAISQPSFADFDATRADTLDPVPPWQPDSMIVMTLQTLRTGLFPGEG